MALGSVYVAPIESIGNLTYTSEGMGKVIHMQNPQDQALATIRTLASDSANVMWSDHASKRLIERGYTATQVHKCLRDGAAIEGPVFDTKVRPGWLCTLETVAAGQWIKVVCKLVETDDGYILVVTVI
jgi:hypothetical protein